MIECGDEYEVRLVFRLFLNSSNYAHPVEARHLDVEEDQVWLKAGDEFHGLNAVFRSANYLYFREVTKEKRELFAGQFLVVYDRSGDGCR